MTIYIDLIFLENIFMNFIILYATTIIVKQDIKIFKMLIGSLIGAIYACVYYVTNLEIYSNIILKIILSFSIVYISFDNKTIYFFLKTVLIFYLTSFTFGGVTFSLLYLINPSKIAFQNGTLVGMYPLKMILVGGLLGFFIIVISFKIIKNRFCKKDMICTIEIQIGLKKKKLKAIIDTGNFLREPITKKPVIVVEKDSIKEIIPANILNNLEEILKGSIVINDEFLSKIKVIPFSALGVENGLLLGINPDGLIVNYQDKKIFRNDVVIGIYNKKFNKNNRYNALLNLDIVENIGE